MISDILPLFIGIILLLLPISSSLSSSTGLSVAAPRCPALCLLVGSWLPDVHFRSHRSPFPSSHQPRSQSVCRSMTEVMYAPSLTSGTSFSGDSPELESSHLLSIDRVSNPSPVNDGSHKSTPSAPQIYRAAGLRPPSHPPTAKDWELYRDVILKTYKAEAKSVKDLKSILAERYGFRAS